MDPKTAVIAALAGGLALQTARARFYRKDAKRLSDVAKAWHGVASPLLEKLRRDLEKDLFDEIVKDL